MLLAMNKEQQITRESQPYDVNLPASNVQTTQENKSLLKKRFQLTNMQTTTAKRTHRSDVSAITLDPALEPHVSLLKDMTTVFPRMRRASLSAAVPIVPQQRQQRRASIAGGEPYTSLSNARQPRRLVDDGPLQQEALQEHRPLQMPQRCPSLSPPQRRKPDPHARAPTDRETLATFLRNNKKLEPTGRTATGGCCSSTLNPERRPVSPTCSKKSLPSTTSPSSSSKHSLSSHELRAQDDNKNRISRRTTVPEQLGPSIAFSKKETSARLLARKTERQTSPHRTKNNDNPSPRKPRVQPLKKTDSPKKRIPSSPLRKSRTSLHTKSAPNENAQDVDSKRDNNNNANNAKTTLDTLDEQPPKKKKSTTRRKQPSPNTRSPRKCAVDPKKEGNPSPFKRRQRARSMSHITENVSRDVFLSSNPERHKIEETSNRSPREVSRDVEPQSGGLTSNTTVERKGNKIEETSNHSLKKVSRGVEQQAAVLSSNPIVDRKGNKIEEANNNSPKKVLSSPRRRRRRVASMQLVSASVLKGDDGKSAERKLLSKSTESNLLKRDVGKSTERNTNPLIYRSRRSMSMQHVSLSAGMDTRVTAKQSTDKRPAEKVTGSTAEIKPELALLKSDSHEGRRERLPERRNYRVRRCTSSDFTSTTGYDSAPETETNPLGDPAKEQKSRYARSRSIGYNSDKMMNNLTSFANAAESKFERMKDRDSKSNDVLGMTDGIFRKGEKKSALTLHDESSVSYAKAGSFLHERFRPNGP